MPRKSDAEHQIIALNPGDITTPRRPLPPADLDRNERELWLGIVESQPAKWFQPASLPLLKTYVQTTIRLEKIQRQLSDEMNTIPFPEQKVGRLTRIHNSMVQQCSSLARNLKLTPLSRSKIRLADLVDEAPTQSLPWEE
jgi:hypothetical protein